MRSLEDGCFALDMHSATRRGIDPGGNAVFMFIPWPRPAHHPRRRPLRERVALFVGLLAVVLRKGVAFLARRPPGRAARCCCVGGLVELRKGVCGVDLRPQRPAPGHTHTHTKTRQAASAHGTRNKGVRTRPGGGRRRRRRLRARTQTTRRATGAVAAHTHTHTHTRTSFFTWAVTAAATACPACSAALSTNRSHGFLVAPSCVCSTWSFAYSSSSSMPNVSLAGSRGAGETGRPETRRRRR